MSTKETGGPAFPVPGWKHDESFNGMTLRDYFAASASEEDIQAFTAFGESWVDPEDRARARYRHADAMLKARQS